MSLLKRSGHHEAGVHEGDATDAGLLRSQLLPATEAGDVREQHTRRHRRTTARGETHTHADTKYPGCQLQQPGHTDLSIRRHAQHSTAAHPRRNVCKLFAVDVQGAVDGQR